MRNVIVSLSTHHHHDRVARHFITLSSNSLELQSDLFCLGSDIWPKYFDPYRTSLMRATEIVEKLSPLALLNFFGLHIVRVPFSGLSSDLKIATNVPRTDEGKRCVDHCDLTI